MKTILTVMAIVCLGMSSFAQEKDSDTTAVPEKDTLRVGDMIIIRSGKDRDSHTYFDSTVKHFRSGSPNIKTNWMIIDLGTSQINDATNYAQAIAAGHLPAGANEDWFDQRSWKSTNVNIWFFMQRLNLVKHVMNLKYGIGLELNNYRYTEPIRYQDNKNPLVIMENVEYSKNKLAADYITVPLMLNFNFTPNSYQHGFGFSAGVSAGYLYSSRQKTVGGGMDKVKKRDDYDLREFKLSYIAEVSLGLIRLYGSYASQSMFENTLNQTPYNFGIRISSW